MENSNQKKSLWKKIGNALAEIFGEILLVGAGVVIVWGLLTVIGRQDLAETLMDSELIWLLGSLAMLALVCIGIALLKRIAKKLEASESNRPCQGQEEENE